MKLTKFLILVLSIFLVSACSSVTLKQENIWTTFQTEAVKNNDIIAVMDTSKWQIKIKLFTNLVPNASYNFIGHALNDYYDNLIFHRVIDDFMIQGGDPKGNGTWWESIYWTPFQDEFVKELKNIPYSLSMANSWANTNGSQFFINEGNNQHLDNKHTVFGQVIEGIDTVNTILETPVWEADKPTQDIIITDINIYTYNDWQLTPYENTLENILKTVDEINTKKLEEKTLKDQDRVSEAGDIVELKYKGFFDNGEVFDENFTESSFLTVTIGQWQVVSGFDKALEGMKIWEIKTVKLSPEEAYGWETIDIERNLLIDFEKDGVKLEAGGILPTGRGNLKIKAVTDTMVTIYNNHPLAGKTLNFDIEINSFIN